MTTCSTGAEWNLDFSGIKGKPELTTHFAIMDITMEVLNLISDDAVLLADVRHDHADRDIRDLCNSGRHALVRRLQPPGSG